MGHTLLKACAWSVLFGAVFVSAAGQSGILGELFDWDLFSTPASSRDGEDPIAHRNCTCAGPSCGCCLDFNISSLVDLGGPGCVSMKFISPEEGIAVNVSYGDSLLHTDKVRGANPEPTCMNLIADLAKICARFNDLRPTNDGLRWCVQLEPIFVGLKVEYPVGCFRLGADGMHLDPEKVNHTENSTDNVEEETTEKPEENLNEAEIIAAVNESAEKGIAFFNDLLFGLASNDTSSDSEGNPASSTNNAKSGNVQDKQRSARGRFQVPATSLNSLS